MTPVSAQGLLLLLTLLLSACASIVTPTAESGQATIPAATSAAPFTQTVLATGLAQPWEIIYGPDNYLWVTERMGKRMRHINPVDGTLTTLVTIDEAHAASGQQGLLGMALHPEFLQDTG